MSELCPTCKRVKATEITRYGGTVPSGACGWAIASRGPAGSGDSIWLANCYGERLRNVDTELRQARSAGWSEGYECGMNDRDNPNWPNAPDTKNSHWRKGDSPT